MSETPISVITDLPRESSPFTTKMKKLSCLFLLNYGTSATEAVKLGEVSLRVAIIIFIQTCNALSTLTHFCAWNCSSVPFFMDIKHFTY